MLLFRFVDVSGLLLCIYGVYIYRVCPSDILSSLICVSLAVVLATPSVYFYPHTPSLIYV